MQPSAGTLQSEAFLKTPPAQMVGCASSSNVMQHVHQEKFALNLKAHKPVDQQTRSGVHSTRALYRLLSVMVTVSVGMGVYISPCGLERLADFS